MQTATRIRAVHRYSGRPIWFDGHGWTLQAANAATYDASDATRLLPQLRTDDDSALDAELVAELVTQS